MNRDDNKKSNFNDWNTYQKLQERIKEFNDTDISTLDKYDYLKTYHNILEMRKKSFPMLLQEGEAFVFDTPPINCYLLPPLKGVENVRWLLIFFVTESNQSQVQIMTWQCDKKATRLKPLAGQSPERIENCIQRLENRPSGIKCAKAGNTHIINLTFPEGVLDLTANTKIGILSNSWQATEKIDNADLNWIERYSYGKMKTAIKIKRYETENWQDDVAFDKKGKVVISSKKPSLGRIHGADGFILNSNWVYMASNRFRVFRLDKSGKCPLSSSERFSNKVLDILAITDKSDKKHFLLVTVHNGAMYLLQDEQSYTQTNEENQETIKIKYWQHTGCPIFRLLGQGDKHILSLDDKGRLTPLRLAININEFRNLYDNATSKLYNIFKTDIRLFLNETDDFLTQDNLVSQGEVAFEYLLSQWKTSGIELSNPELWESFRVWFQWLDDYYGQKAEPNIEIVRLHSHIITRLFHWMQKFCFLPPGSKVKKPDEYKQVELALNTIYQLITPRKEAPDIIWTHLLRKSDWVRSWEKSLSLNSQFPKCKDIYANWQTRLWQQRLWIAKGLYRTRPFHTVSSYRFSSQPSYIEVIDEEEKLIAVLESNRSLRILKIPPEGKEWKELVHLSRNVGSDSWQGQPTLLKQLPSNQPHIIRLLVGTHRGDLVVLKWNKKQSGKIEQEFRYNYKHFDIMSYATVNWHTKLHLLGGKTNDNLPCLYALPTATQLHSNSLKLLWSGEQSSKGSLRILTINKQRTLLWGINREAGELLCWNILPSYNNKLLLSQPKIWLQVVHPLNRLGYSAEHNLLICGGQGGLVYALDAETGTLCWVVNISGNLRHLMYLPCKLEAERTPLKGIWLLSSDDKSSLVVNQFGQVVGTLENTGVVSTLAILKQTLLIGTLDGRLVLMDSQQLLPDEHYEPLSEVGSFSPLQCQTVPSQSKLIKFLQCDQGKETLVSTMVLQHFLGFCKQTEENLSKELLNAFFDNWEKQSLERKIVFLYTLRTIVCEGETLAQSSLEFIVNLIKRCWQDVEIINESSLLCKFLSPLFDISYKLIEVFQTLVEEGEFSSDQLLTDTKELLSKMQACLWLPKIENQQNDPCQQYDVLQKGMALVATRLNQALKCWRSTNTESENIKSSDLRIFNWCNLMYSECLANNLETFQTTIKYLFSNNLYLLEKDNAWQLWIESLANGKKTEAPSPLNYLQSFKNSSFNDHNLNQLQSAFADNISWQQWVNSLQNCLKAVETSSQSKPHQAWSERASWRSLREHIGIQGAETFTVAKDQILLALWWQDLKKPWLNYIDKQLLILEQQVEKTPNQYLQVETQERWLDAKNAEVSLIIVNRFPYSLNLQQLHWQGKNLNIQALPIQLSADENRKNIKIYLRGTEDNFLQDRLLLRCTRAQSNKKIDIKVNIRCQRNLMELSTEVQWQPTWKRLVMLLDDNEKKQQFYWLNGDTWPQKERQLLKQDVLKKYTLEIDRLPRLSTTDNRSLSYPIFSPDIALAAKPEKQIEQLHGIIQKWAGNNAFYWALAVWHWAKNTVSQSIQLAIGGLLPKQHLVKQLLTSLFDNSTKRVNEITVVLKQLPPQALGAWCSEEPFYVLKNNEVVLPDELYLPTACLLTSNTWKQLDQADVPATDIAIFLDCTEEQAVQDKAMRADFFSIPEFFQGQDKSIPSPKMDQFSQLFFTKFGESSVSYLKPAWQQKNAITLNWEDVNNLYLLPKTLSFERTALIKYPKGLWLALGETYALSELNDSNQKNEAKNICLTLNINQALSLLHTQADTEANKKTNTQVSILLNRFAAPQRKINDELAFRTAMGLSSLVDKHFYGRDKALVTLRNCLAEADHKNSSGSAALLVAGRRMGKTSLRERILFELKRDKSPRICLEFNFEGEAILNDINGIELEWWFFNEIKKRFETCGHPFHFIWPKREKDSNDARKKNRDLLRDHLTKLKQQSEGETVLFTFDETEHLVKADAKGVKETSFMLFGFFRSLIQDSLLCLFATSYPYGAEASWALNIAKNNSNSPTHNTFSKYIELKAWSPKTAWNFLVSRLAGFGIVFPRYYRYEMLDISRGVPWIIHQLGQSICTELTKQYEDDKNKNRIVTALIWQKAKKETLKKMHEVMQESVEKMALQQDIAFNLPIATDPKKILSGGNLRRALTIIAKKRKYPEVLQDNDWAEAVEFKLKELQNYLPNIKEEALEKAVAMLSSSPVIEGITTSNKDYIFASNLLLVWLHHSVGETL